MADTTMQERKYPPGQHPDLPAPIGTVGVLGWLRTNLFSSIPNSIATLLALYLVYLALPPILNWAIFEADVSGSSRTDCTSAGACWALVRVRFNQFMYGFYPQGQYWRVNLAGILLLLALVPVLFEKVPYRKIGMLFSAFYPIIAFVLLYGGLGLPEVATDRWGGLMLTIVVGMTGIVASLPIGILLALGRRSQMPVVRMLCVAFIELIRGVPLITVLFMASVVLPLFLPEGVNFNKLLRVLIGVALFSSAYMAEVVRGGLQAIPKGQYEAAQALGLSYWKMMGLIVLPQALRIVIPGIVNTFIGLFKDTTLVLIVGLFDLLQSAKSAITDANWIGLSNEAYAFAGAVFFIFCFSMSRYSIWLEKQLHTGHKR
ncbi:MAG: amino acid ABC transporter permease [Kiloniellales bacterium]